MSLSIVPLKLWSLNMTYRLIFLLKKMWVAFAFAKPTHIFFQQKIPVNYILYLLEALIFWPLTSLLSLRLFEQLGPGILGWPWNRYMHAALRPFSCFAHQSNLAKKKKKKKKKKKNLRARIGVFVCGVCFVFIFFSCIFRLVPQEAVLCDCGIFSVSWHMF